MSTNSARGGQDKEAWGSEYDTDESQDAWKVAGRLALQQTTGNVTVAYEYDRSRLLHPILSDEQVRRIYELKRNEEPEGWLGEVPLRVLLEDAAFMQPILASDVGVQEEWSVAFGRCRTAEDLLAACFQGLIAFVLARKPRLLNTLSFDEGMNAGNEGLSKAIHTFDPKLGSKFVTYAGWQVYAKILAEESAQEGLSRSIADAVPMARYFKWGYEQATGAPTTPDTLIRLMVAYAHGRGGRQSVTLGAIKGAVNYLFGNQINNSLDADNGPNAVGEQMPAVVEPDISPELQAALLRLPLVQRELVTAQYELSASTVAEVVEKWRLNPSIAQAELRSALQTLSELMTPAKKPEASRMVGNFPDLTPQQVEVLSLIRQGNLGKTICKQLDFTRQRLDQQISVLIAKGYLAERPPLTANKLRAYRIRQAILAGQTVDEILKLVPGTSRIMVRSVARQIMREEGVKASVYQPSNPRNALRAYLLNHETSDMRAFREWLESDARNRKGAVL